MTVPGERNEEQLAIIEALKQLPELVEAETSGVSDAVLRHRAAEGEWSIKEIVGHLRDMAEVWHKRLYAAWSLTDPLWPGFDGEASIKDNAYQEADLISTVASLREWREKTVDLLSQAVDWTRLGQHGEMGRRSLKQWAQFVVAHDAEHLASIRTLRAEQRVEEPG